tara:strand:+ start:693 stop:995 length:303 start_codon:yes stop_codon:yes gene_type:complete
MNNDPQIKVDIREESGKIYCRLEVPRWGRECRKVYIIHNNEVLAFLAQNGYPHAVLREGAYIDNRRPESPTLGTWVCENAQPAAKPSGRKRTTKSNNSKK